MAMIFDALVFPATRILGISCLATFNKRAQSGVPLSEQLLRAYEQHS
jgi:hypothetical protein